MNQNIDPLILKSLPFDPLPGDFDLTRKESYHSEIGRKACFSLLRRLLKDKRYFHSISVGSLCEIAAIEQGKDSLDARWAGVLHDLAKRVAKGEKGKALMEKYYPQYADLPDWTYHQFLGALLAKSSLGWKTPMFWMRLAFMLQAKRI
ncbi:MAG: HD domain-containing protein [Bacilli bacterium]|nr:HD domain-containing protein [Bacilli bacterium]